MSPLEDPMRLRFKLSQKTMLSRAITAAHECGPDEEQLRALERKVLAAAGATAAVTAAAVAAKVVHKQATGGMAAWLTAGTSKVLLALVTVGLVGGGMAAVRFYGRTSSNAAAPAAVANAALIDPAEKTRPAEARPAQAQSAGHTAATEEPPSAHDDRVQPSVDHGRGVRRPQGRMSSELAGDDDLPLLERAHRSLATKPSVALALSRDHARRFPASALDQEREIIIITALVRLGRSEEAQREARRFAARHPDSAYVAKIERILQARP